VHAMTAPTSATGKSLLISLASILACGQSAAVIAQGRNDDEFRKLLATELMSGKPIIAIDNCQRPLSGDLLCQAITEGQINLRVLGHSRTVLVPASALITATGNNLMLGDDMSRRVLLCAIDAGVERPEKRKFKVKIKKLFRQRRGELVTALLTVLRAARLAQAEIARLDLEPLGGFEDWCEWVRDPLVWLGRTDPCASMEASYESNVDREALRIVLLAWRDHVNSRADSSAQQVIDQANQMGALGTYRFPALREALLLVAEEHGRPGVLSAKRLGWWLRKVNGRPCDELRLIKVRGPHGHPRWRLQK
jgi:putative DNA primase/helicase